MNGNGNGIETENNANDKQTEILLRRLKAFVKMEQNEHLDEMLSSLINYKTGLELNNNNHRFAQSKKFRISFYSSLENLLYQISDIKSKRIRQQKIPVLYRWFKEKADTHNTLSLIRIQSTMGLDQDYTQEISNCDRIIETNEQLTHRSQDATAAGVSEQLKFYKVKKLGEFKVNESNKSAKEPNEEKEGKQIDKVPKFNEKENNQNQMASTNKTQTKSIYYSSDILNKTKAFTKSTFITNSTLFNHNLTTRDILPSKEVKSSYSYSRPPYEFSLLKLENEIMKAKNKELADKRAQESIRLTLKDYGITRAKYKEQMIKKRELKDLVTFYKGTPREYLNHNYNTNMNRMICLQKSKLNKKMTTSNLRYELVKKRHTRSIIQEESIKGIDISKRESVSIPTPAPKRLIARSKSQYITPIEKSALKMNKVTINQIKNIDEIKSIIQPVIPEVNISFKAKQMVLSSIKANNITSKVSQIEMPSDTVSTSIHYSKIMKTRLNNKSLCDVNEIDTSKKEYLSNFEPISAFDLSSCRSFDKFNITSSLYASHSGYDFAKNNFLLHSNDFLNLKKTIDNFKSHEISKLKKKIARQQNEVNKGALNQAFSNPNITSYYPVSYLPHSGSGLLNIPPVPVVSKK